MIHCQWRYCGYLSLLLLLRHSAIRNRKSDGSNKDSNNDYNDDTS